MVELPSSLRERTLGDVLGALHRHRVSGALRLDEVANSQSRRHAIHWREGLIYDVETALPVTPFADLLGAHVRFPRTPGTRRGVDRTAFEQALGRQRLERLDALFGLRQVRLTFSAMTRSRRPFTPLSPREFLHGRPRARDGQHAAAPPRSHYDAARADALRTLGLREPATSSDVRDAFRRLARRFHPDLHPSADGATKADLGRRFAEVALAYHTLRNAA